MLNGPSEINITLIYLYFLLRYAHNENNNVIRKKMRRINLIVHRFYLPQKVTCHAINKNIQKYI